MQHNSNEDVIFIPTRPHAGSARELPVDVYFLANGRRAIRGYTSLRTLQKCCGEHQQWMLLNEGGLAELKRLSGVEVVCLNVRMPSPAPALRR